MYQINPFWGTAANGWNPSDLSSNGSLSNSNRTLSYTGSGSNGRVRSTDNYSSGKYYFEGKLDTKGGGNANHPRFGVMGNAVAIGSFNPGPFGNTNDRGTYLQSPNTNGYVVYQPGSNISFESGAVVAGDVWGYAIDFTLGRMWIHKNGTYSVPGANPATNTSPSLTGLSGTWFAFCVISSGDVTTSHFTRADMAYTVPSGFLAWDGT